MNQKLFEFIWDQSKKNTDKGLVEHIVALQTCMEEDKKDIHDRIGYVEERLRINREEQYGQLEIVAKNLDDEINRVQQSLSDRIDKFEDAVWSRFSEQENPVPEKKQK